MPGRSGRSAAEAADGTAPAQPAATSGRAGGGAAAGRPGFGGQLSRPLILALSAVSALCVAARAFSPELSTASPGLGSSIDAAAGRGGAEVSAATAPGGADATYTSTRALAAVTTSTAPRPRLQLNVSQLAWLHPPKAGTSFVNTLLSYACPGMGDSDFISRLQYDSQVLLKKARTLENWKCDRGLELRCNHKQISFAPDKDLMHPRGCNSWRASKGSFVTLLRQPEQRIISGWIHDKHGTDNNRNLNLIAYAEVAAGCQVRMLNGIRCYDNSKPLTEAHVNTAIKHLDEGFAFVGITEEYDLSICLFHAMFGGRCRQGEFVNIRPSTSRYRKQCHRECHTLMEPAAQHNTSALAGWTDRLDRPLYEHAVGLFRAGLRRHGVSREACRQQVCPCCPAAFPLDGSAPVPVMDVVGLARMPAAPKTALRPPG